MYDLIKRLLAFLLPIVRSAALEVAADVVNEAAYPRRRPYTSYRRYSRPRPAASYTFKRPDISSPDEFRDAYGVNRLRPMPAKGYVKDEHKEENSDRYHENYDKVHNNPDGFHDVLLVAFDVRGKTALEVHNWLESQMPYADTFYGENEDIYVDSWWVANDERFDGSDTASAVFVPKGDQEAAREVLREKGFIV